MAFRIAVEERPESARTGNPDPLTLNPWLVDLAIRVPTSELAQRYDLAIARHAAQAVRDVPRVKHVSLLLTRAHALLGNWERRHARGGWGDRHAVGPIAECAGRSGVRVGSGVGRQSMSINKELAQAVVASRGTSRCLLATHDLLRVLTAKLP